MKTIDIKEAVRILNFHKISRKGTAFTVWFIKRTTGELRKMNCRFNVEKFLAGGELKYDPSSKNLMIVCDMQAILNGSDKPYRSINLNEITQLHINGEQFEVVK